LYPNPRDSRETIPNPDYHPPISYIDGKFVYENGSPVPKNAIPAYILEAVKKLPKMAKPHETAEYEMSDIMAGKPMLDEALTHKVLAQQEAEKKKAAKKRKTTRRRSPRTRAKKAA
jgi:hypothetical protein